MVMSSTDTSHSADSEDAWGQRTISIIDPSRVNAASQSAPVPDDWDADDDEEEPDAKTLWVTANSRAPMPEIQLSTTSSSTSVPLLPRAAYEAPLRILKRPSTNSKSPSPSTGGQTQKTFKEREAQYQAARERIFGEEASGKDKDGSGSGKPKMALDSAKSSIIRDPLGPTSIIDGEAKQGFRARWKKRPRAAKTGTSTPDSSGDHPANT